MTPHDHDLMAIAGKWVLEHIVLIVGGVAGFFGSVSWIAHQRFATIKELEKTNKALTDCKEATVAEFQQALDKHEKRELEAEKDAHAEIKEDIAQLYLKVGSIDDKVDQLKNMLLQKEWFK